MRTIDFVFTMVKLINLFWVFFELPPIVNRKVNLVMSQKKWLFFVFSFVLPYVCKCWKNIFYKKYKNFIQITKNPRIEILPKKIIFFAIFWAIAVRVINVELSSLARWDMICLCLIASPVSCCVFVLNVLNIESFGNSVFRMNHQFVHHT